MDPVGPTEFDHLNAPECQVKDSFGSEFLRFARLQPYNVTSLMFDWSPIGAKYLDGELK